MSRIELRPTFPALTKPTLRSVALGGAPLLVLSALCVLLATLFAGYAFDDPFVTYRYAENVLAGRGFTYNAGTRVLSTTTPLYALLLVIPGALGLPIPLASNTIGCVSIGLAALALWRLGRLWGTPGAGWIMLLLFPLNTLVLSALGGESSLYVALILWAFVACRSRHYVAAALLLAAATLTRADGLLAAGAAAALVLVQHFADRRGPGRLAATIRDLPWRALAVFVALLAVWALFAVWYFGSPVPATLAAKQHQGQLAVSRSFLRGLYGQARGLTDGLLFRAQIVFVLLGLTAVLARYRGWLVLLGWSLLYVAGYTLLGVSGYFWYYVPLAPAFVALVALGIDQTARVAGSMLSPSKARQALMLRWALAAVLTGALALGYAGRLQAARASGDARAAIYERVGTWLREHTPVDASVGALEVGMIGYYAERSMVDFAGLLQPDVARILGPRTTYDDAALYALEQYRPRYLVLQRGVLPRLEARAAEQGLCRVETTFTDPRYPFPLDVYACRWEPRMRNK